MPRGLITKQDLPRKVKAAFCHPYREFKFESHTTKLSICARSRLVLGWEYTQVSLECLLNVNLFDVNA